jgi:hypothetical protein
VYRAPLTREETLGSALHFAIEGIEFDGSLEEKLIVEKCIPVTNLLADIVRFLLRRGVQIRSSRWEWEDGVGDGKRSRRKRNCWDTGTQARRG